MLVSRLEKRTSSPEVKSGERMESDQRGSALSLQAATKRLHRQSTISCDGNFATTTEARRKTAEQEFGALAETDEPQQQQQPRPAVDECWPVKWDAPKNGSLASPVSQTDSRNSLSVPSTPMQHQAFTFDVFNGNNCTVLNFKIT